MLETIENRVRSRLIKYLGRDDTGIRKVVLKLFLDGGKYTTNDIYKFLVRVVPSHGSQLKV